MQPDANLCPQPLRESIDTYVELGRAPGSFLRAVLENDLMAAVMKADEFNQALLPHIVAYVRETVPFIAFGSARNVEAYIEAKRISRQHSVITCMCSAKRFGRKHTGLCAKCREAGCAETDMTAACKLTGETAP